MVEGNRFAPHNTPGIEYEDWIRGEVAANTPYDEFTYKLLTASGSRDISTWSVSPN